MLGGIEAAPVAEASPLSPAVPLLRANWLSRWGAARGGHWLIAYDWAADSPPAVVFATLTKDP
jgi:hypothetical protein